MTPVNNALQVLVSSHATEWPVSALNLTLSACRDLFMAILLLYVCIVLPYAIAFDTDFVSITPSTANMLVLSQIMMLILCFHAEYKGASCHFCCHAVRLDLPAGCAGPDHHQPVCGGCLDELSHSNPG